MLQRVLLSVLVLALVTLSLRAEVKVTEVEVKPRWPWNGLVDVTYSIECDEVDDAGKPTNVYVDFTGYDQDRDRTVRMRSLTGDGADAPVHAGGPYAVTWDAGADEPSINVAAFLVKVHAMAGLGTYMVVDLTTGAVRYSAEAPDPSDDTCRTTELWLRQIPAGTFTMGSPEDELGRWSDETQHEVTITQMFYIGVFECTQKQYNLITGDNPSYYQGETRPVEQVSYDMIRGTSATAGAGWPSYGHAVDADSFFGKLQSLAGLVFDLPTEAEWEYSCRAGTTTALNSGKNLASTDQDANMAEVGRCDYNIYDGKGGYSEHTKVGSYLPNAWGLYDMHGNICEWCLDWYGSYPASAVEDPAGSSTGSYRVLRGGSCYSIARHCRSAYRVNYFPSDYGCDNFGFRVACWPLVR